MPYFALSFDYLLWPAIQPGWVMTTTNAMWMIWWDGERSKQREAEIWTEAQVSITVQWIFYNLQFYHLNTMEIHLCCAEPHQMDEWMCSLSLVQRRRDNKSDRQSVDLTDWSDGWMVDAWMVPFRNRSSQVKAAIQSLFSLEWSSQRGEWLVTVGYRVTESKIWRWDSP